MLARATDRELLRNGRAEPALQDDGSVRVGVLDVCPATTGRPARRLLVDLGLHPHRGRRSRARRPDRPNHRCQHSRRREATSRYADRLLGAGDYADQLAQEQATRTVDEQALPLAEHRRHELSEMKADILASDSNCRVRRSPSSSRTAAMCPRCCFGPPARSRPFPRRLGTPRPSTTSTAAPTCAPREWPFGTFPQVRGGKTWWAILGLNQ